MPTIKKILFPVDFSERCRGAGQYVQSLAGQFDAEITMLHVVDLATYGAMAERIVPPKQTQLDAFLEDEFKSLEVHRLCVAGDPANEIVATIRSSVPDLVMMPSYGLGRYRRGLLGSVTAKVLHDVGCPVWTSVHSEHPPPAGRMAFRKVLCALDLGERSRRVLDWAAWLACESQAELTVTYSSPLVEAPELEAEARSKIGALMFAAGAGGAVLIREGEPRKTVPCAAAELRSDVLVIGRHDECGDDRELRQNAFGIIRESPCPVISI